MAEAYTAKHMAERQRRASSQCFIYRSSISLPFIMKSNLGPSPSRVQNQ
jgi:hypothetical protein